MSIGTFIPTRNEASWIAAHILRVLPYVDEMIFYDDFSRDGTPEIIEAIRASHKQGSKIKLFREKTHKNLKDDYVRLFNDCMHELSTDLAWFLHPDMYVVNPLQILQARQSKAVALSTRMSSFAGEPGGAVFQTQGGRIGAWKNIYRLRNPDLGAHYAGWPGAPEEDVYFFDLTGEEHKYHGLNFHEYPYRVEDSGIQTMHFSEVRSYEFRLDRMEHCLKAQGANPELAKKHPRVSLEDGHGFSFVPLEQTPYVRFWEDIQRNRKSFQYLEKEHKFVKKGEG